MAPPSSTTPTMLAVTAQYAIVFFCANRFTLFGILSICHPPGGSVVARRGGREVGVRVQVNYWRAWSVFWQNVNAQDSGCVDALQELDRVCLTAIKFRVVPKIDSPQKERVMTVIVPVGAIHQLDLARARRRTALRD